MKIYAIIPARSGSKGFPNKNIHLLNGLPLIGYSIRFAQKLNCDKIICSTDSEEYKKIAEKLGAEVPFLRSSEASGDTAMEEDILKDLYFKFQEYDIPMPDIIIWLRPTFVFRDLITTLKGIEILRHTPEINSVRTICETEARLYSIDTENKLTPHFDDRGKSMIRRQDIGTFYKVFSTDIFRFNQENLNNDFLGRNVIGLPISKICGLDIDDETDFKIIESIVQSKNAGVIKYLHN